VIVLSWLRGLLLRPSKHGPTKTLPNSLPSSSKSENDEPKAEVTRRPPKTEPRFQETFLQSPNVSQRVIRPELIVVHHTDGSYLGSVAWCRNPASKVSYHCIIARDGRRTVLAKPTQRAWHAGVSSWKGRRDVNSFSHGVAFSGNTYTDPLEPDAIESFLEYVIPLMKSYGISADQFTDHRTIAPSRKVDIEAHSLADLHWRVKKALAV
jgi:N-acetyl-anhydromuramyl-L-alanine amidase AmpD